MAIPIIYNQKRKPGSYGAYIISINHINGDPICAHTSNDSQAWDKGDQKSFAMEALRMSGLSTEDYDLSGLKEYEED